MTEAQERDVVSWKVIKRLLLFIRPHMVWLILMVITSLVLAGLNILNAYALKGAIDATLSHAMGQLSKYLYLVIAAMVVEIPVSMLRTYATGRFSEKSLYDIRQHTTEHISKLPVSYLEKHPTGDLVSRLTNDISLIQGFLQGSLSELISQPLTFIAAAIYVFIISWKLTLFSVVAVPLLMWLTIKLSEPIEKYTKSQQESLSNVNSIAQDSISGLVVTKSFTLEGVMLRKYNDAVDKALGKALKVAKVQAVLEPVRAFMQMAPFMVTFAYGGYLAINNQMTFGGVLAFINLLNFVVNPITLIPRLISSFRSTTAAARRIFEVWDEPQERSDGKVFSVDKNAAAISFDNVCFSYNEDEKLLFDHLSFEIYSGETVALVGPSGCGKSTVLKLITGFYKPTTGRILIYGHDMEEWSLEGVRDLISVVSQDTYLFPDSIYENIAYGKKDASESEIKEAARLAGIHDFIENLPDKYNTMVGERGVKLSGGQRQRIAIARAILKNAPILLLDEATSALDTESEYYIQQSLEELMEGRTSLVIAHRLSTIKNADRILVMNNGKIVETGTHDELYNSDSLYRQLYLKQYQLDEEANGVA